MSKVFLKTACEFMWDSTRERNEYSGKFQIDCCNLSQEACKELQEHGITVLSNPNKPEKGNYITAKSANYEIAVVDKDGNIIKGQVGNGSKGYAIITPYSWKHMGKSGTNAGTSKIVVTDLITYDPNAAEAVVEDDEVL